ncbi:hypothetical protein Pelo_13418 [Pelomyxa schiedti]|nr:hypothetical protein Pelo_13418 [Pelomyxa schiedti]
MRLVLVLTKLPGLLLDSVKTYCYQFNNVGPVFEVEETKPQTHTSASVTSVTNRVGLSHFSETDSTAPGKNGLNQILDEMSDGITTGLVEVPLIETEVTRNSRDCCNSAEAFFKLLQEVVRPGNRGAIPIISLMSRYDPKALTALFYPCAE